MRNARPLERVLTGLIPELLDRVSQGHKAVDFFVEPVLPHAPPDDGVFQLMTSYARHDGSWEVRAFALSLLATRGAHPADLADDVASAVTLQGIRGKPGWARRVLQTARDLHRPEG